MRRRPSQQGCDALRCPCRQILIDLRQIGGDDSALGEALRALAAADHGLPGRGRALAALRVQSTLPASEVTGTSRATMRPRREMAISSPVATRRSSLA